MMKTCDDAVVLGILAAVIYFGVMHLLGLSTETAVYVGTVATWIIVFLGYIAIEEAKHLSNKSKKNEDLFLFGILLALLGNFVITGFDRILFCLLADNSACSRQQQAYATAVLTAFSMLAIISITVYAKYYRPKRIAS